MNNRTLYILTAFLIVGTAILMSFKPSIETITHEGDTTIINTTEIGKSIEGYNGKLNRSTTRRHQNSSQKRKLC